MSYEEYAAKNPLLLPKPLQLADFLQSEDDNITSSDIFYDLSSVILEEDLIRMLVEFLEQYPEWESRQVHFHTSKNNIPLVDYVQVLIQLPDYTSVEMLLPLYQFDVKANSEELWRIFKIVLKGDKNGPSWRRSLEDFTGLHSSNHYHVRRLETAEVKRQAITDFIARYNAAGIKSIPIKQERGYYPWFMLSSKDASGPVRLCVVIDKDTLEQNHSQFFEFAALFKNREQALSGHK